MKEQFSDGWLFYCFLLVEKWMGLVLEGVCNCFDFEFMMVCMMT